MADSSHEAVDATVTEQFIGQREDLLKLIEGRTLRIKKQLKIMGDRMPKLRNTVAVFLAKRHIAESVLIKKKVEE